MLFGTLIADDFTQTFGTVAAPQGVAELNAAGGGIGLLLFVSNLIKLATIVAGVWVLFNFITAGLDYITSAGDSAVSNKVKDKLTMSVMGLIIIVGSYSIIALLSYFLFRDATYILNPKIQGAL